MADDQTFGSAVFERFTERWPEAGDRLLSPGRDTFLAEGADERSFRLLRGYKRAGDVLVKAALTERYDRDNLVFPAIFNYRHYIELALKALLEEHGSFAGVALGKRNHKLPELWELFVTIAKAFGNNRMDSAAVAVGECITEIAGVDPSSTTFRYARDCDGSTTVLPENGLDLVQLHDVMNGIENFFECADLDFTHKREYSA